MSKNNGKNFYGYDLKKLADGYFQASKENAVESNKVTSSLFGYIFVVSTFFLGFVLSMPRVVGSMDITNIVFFVLSIFSGIISILLGILTIMHSRTFLVYKARYYLDLCNKCLESIRKNKRYLMEKLPNELKVDKEQIIAPAGKYGKWCIIFFLTQIIAGALVLLSKFISISFKFPFDIS